MSDGCISKSPQTKPHGDDGKRSVMKKLCPVRCVCVFWSKQRRCLVCGGGPGFPVHVHVQRHDEPSHPLPGRRRACGLLCVAAYMQRAVQGGVRGMRCTRSCTIDKFSSSLKSCSDGVENKVHSMFSSISIMKFPAVLTGVQIRAGTGSGRSVTKHVFAFLALS